MVVLSAGLKAISSDVIEAARVDGANEFQIFRRIILPLVSPTIAVVATTLVIQSLKIFDIVWVMTAGNYNTDVIATQMYKQLFNYQNFGLSGALAVILLLAIIPVMLVSINRFRGQEETDERTGQTISAKDGCKCFRHRWTRFLARFPLHVVIIVLALLWMTPTVGLLISSFRPANLISTQAGGRLSRPLSSLP